MSCNCPNWTAGGKCLPSSGYHTLPLQQHSCIPGKDAGNVTFLWIWFLIIEQEMIWPQKEPQLLHPMKHSNAWLALNVVLFCCTWIMRSEDAVLWSWTWEYEQSYSESNKLCKTICAWNVNVSRWCKQALFKPLLKTQRSLGTKPYGLSQRPIASLMLLPASKDLGN